MSVYMVMDSHVLDQEAYDQYLQLVPPIVARYGGRYLVSGGKITPLGNKEWQPERMIILEFPAMENIQQWLISPEYRQIAPLRERGADVRAVALEEYPQKAP